MLASQDALDVGHRLGNPVLRLGEDADRPKPIAADHAKARRVDRDEYLIIRIAERRRLTLRFENTDDRELDAADANVLTQQCLWRIEAHVRRDGRADHRDTLPAFVLGRR